MTQQEQIYYNIVIHFGGAKKAYQALGIAPSTFYKWKTKTIPYRHIRTIELTSKLALKRQYLLPKTFNNNENKN
jgi:hypothetical protein